ncbi:MAG: hypothetical protein AAF688_02190 [Bacteroidota bacterium]
MKLINKTKLSFLTREVRARYGILLMVFLMCLVLIACDNDDDNNCQGIECLPPATQTGAGTFGCLVNGEPFVDNSGSFNCFYQFVNGEYFFGIQAEGSVGKLRAIAIGSLQKEIEPNTPIPLNLRVDNEFYALLDFNILQQEGSTNSSNDGFITFTQLTTNPNVVSAIFEFTIEDPVTNEIYEISEGRFDAQFTQ